ncbi:hypothetical protein Tco_0271369 [Tanacetum coccineum]
MRSDELHKFSDGTLQSVRDTLHDMANNLRMGYKKVMPKRRWINVIPMVAASGLRQVRFIATCSYSTDILLKLKNFKEDGYSSFQDKEKYEHVDPKVTSSHEGKRSQDDDKRLDLTDDLKKAQDHIQVKLKETSSSLKSKISLHISQDDDKDTRLRA